VIALLALTSLLLALFLVESRSCMLSGLFMVCLYLFLKLDRTKLVFCFTTLSIALVSIDLILEHSILQNFLLVRVENARLGVWYAGLVYWKENPLIGLGPSQFEVAYNEVMSNLDPPSWLMVDKRVVPWAHNLYIEALVERGILGLGSLIFLFAFSFSSIKKHLNVKDKKQKNLNLAVFLSFSGFMFSGLLELTLQRIWVANGMFIFLAMAYALDRKEKVLDNLNEQNPRLT
jgi:O-antigen ligase